ncbi:MAG TPA: hypothetical protein VNB52_12750 [Ilumatobacteraceae bacterium]|nr:hypothetical protein [Ilumatobacteraceae bacterium]
MTTFGLNAASEFITNHARTLDRRRFERLLGQPDPDGVIDALAAYRNSDNGFGWGLEPDLRSRTSQPAGALHAFEAIAEIAPTTTPLAAALCDWLDTIALPDGGLPFALPIDDPVGCASFWVQADPTTSSLQITAAVTANACRVAINDPAVATHPWLARSKKFCFDAIAALTTQPHAYVLAFALHFLDAVADAPQTAAAIDQLRPYVPADGAIHVDGGTEDETLHPLDLAPDPNGPARALLTRESIAADLDRVARDQQPDGGWQFDWTASSPGAVLEWRGYVTVRTVGILLDNA